MKSPDGFKTRQSTASFKMRNMTLKTISKRTAPCGKGGLGRDARIESPHLERFSLGLRTEALVGSAVRTAFLGPGMVRTADPTWAVRT